MSGPLRAVRAATVLLAAGALLAAAPVRGDAGGRPDGSPDDPVFSTTGIPSGFSLPEAARDPDVPPPAAVVGHRIGDALTPGEDVVRYARAVEGATPRVRVSRYGLTPEGRELVLVLVSAPETLRRLDEIRKDLVALRDPRATDAAAARRIAERSPAVVWIACGVHGDEAAGPEAAMALLYQLAASRSDDVLAILRDAVVVIDPVANPDGRARHVAYWRSVAGEPPDADPDSLENTPPWPDGRTNHFGFDLNRDWAWATQPETRARIAALASLPPQVYVDVHEMSPEGSYFLPPPAEPIHPRVPEGTRSWLAAFGSAISRAFDARGWGYFSRETYDLFYPAYGDSWPVFHGMVGMTLEVGGSGGLAYRRQDGRVVTLEERALKHFTALGAIVRAAAARRRDLLEDQARLARTTREEGRRTFVVPSDQDPARLAALARLLVLQGVEVRRTVKPLADVPRAGASLPAGSLLVDTAQPNGRFAEVVLEPQAALPESFLREERLRLLREEDDRFYDVTAWSLPLALALRSESVASAPRLRAASEGWAEPPAPEGIGNPAYGWALPGDDGTSRKAAGLLLGSGVRVRATLKACRVAGRTLAPGTFVIDRETNTGLGRRLEELVANAVAGAGARPVPLERAATEEGPSFGSRTLLSLEVPKVVLLTGDGADTSSVGALRLALERDLGVWPALRRARALSRLKLDGVTVVVVPNGGKAFTAALLDEDNADALRRFVESGGVVVGVRKGAAVLSEKPLSLSEVATWEAPKTPTDAPSTAEGGAAAGAGGGRDSAAGADPKASPAARPAAAGPPTPVAALEDDLGRRVLPVPGAALRTEATPEHPFLLGLESSPPFLVTDGAPPRRLPHARQNVVTVSGDPLASGFGWKEALERWRGAPVVQLEEVGEGKVVRFAADPVFRGIWLGSEIVFLDAVLFGPSL